MYRCFTLIPLLFAAAAAQGADTYDFDRKHTQILFFVNHLGFSMSQGEFHDYVGQYKFDPDNWADSSVEIHIRTHSIDMDDYEWDQHLRSEDFFNVDANPVMSFRSTRVEQTGDNTGKLHGELTLLRQTRPVVLDVHLNKAGVHPKSKKFTTGFSATGTLLRSEWGMDYATPFVGDKVELRLEVEGNRVGE